MIPCVHHFAQSSAHGCHARARCKTVLCALQNNYSILEHSNGCISIALREKIVFASLLKACLSLCSADINKPLGKEYAFAHLTIMAAPHNCMDHFCQIVYIVLHCTPGYDQAQKSPNNAFKRHVYLQK